MKYPEDDLGEVKERYFVWPEETNEDLEIIQKEDLIRWECPPCHDESNTDASIEQLVDDEKYRRNRHWSDVNIIDVTDDLHKDV